MFRLTHFKFSFLDLPCITDFFVCCLSGKKDHVICFQYGVQVGEWQESDNPGVEHAKWNHTCLYVKHLKGLEFIKECQLFLSAEKSDVFSFTKSVCVCEYFKIDNYSTCSLLDKTEFYVENSDLYLFKNVN